MMEIAFIGPAASRAWALDARVAGLRAEVNLVLPDTAAPAAAQFAGAFEPEPR